VADGWCWFVLREEYCWLVADGWFVLREKYCWLVADKPSEQGAYLKDRDSENGLEFRWESYAWSFNKTCIMTTPSRPTVTFRWTPSYLDASMNFFFLHACLLLYNEWANVACICTFLSHFIFPFMIKWVARVTQRAHVAAHPGSLSVAGDRDRSYIRVWSTELLSWQNWSGLVNMGWCDGRDSGGRIRQWPSDGSPLCEHLKCRHLNSPSMHAAC
jgi:hypothetical protein